MIKSMRNLLWLIASLTAAMSLVLLSTGTSGVRTRLPTVAGTSAITAQKVVEGITRESLEHHINAFAPYPTRMAGTPGSDHAAQHIRTTFAGAGLKVLEHPIPLTVPVTRYCQVLDRDGAEIAGVKLHPFWPNVVRTCTIREPGLAGTAVMAPRGSAFVYGFGGHDPASTIAMVRTSSAEQWIGLADAGFRAIVFFDDPSVQPTDYMLKELDIPANIPRFYLQGDPRALDGKSIRIRCKVDWQTVWTPQIVGVLETAESQAVREAVIVTAHYDSVGWIPDCAPGAEEASSLAGMLALAEFAGGQREHLKRPMVFVAFAGHGQACAGARWFAHLWGPAGGESAAARRLERRLDELNTQAKLCNHQFGMLDDEGYWSNAGDDSEATRLERAFWKQQPAGLEDAMIDDVRALTDLNVQAVQEVMIQCDLRRKRKLESNEDLEAAYQAARHDVERRRIAATATLLEMKTHHGLAPDGELLVALKRRLAHKRDRLKLDIARTQQSQQVQRVLHSLDNHFAFSFAYTSGSPIISLTAHYPETAMRHGAKNWFGQIAAQIADDTRPLLPVLVQADPDDPTAQARARGLLVNRLAEPGSPYSQGELDGGSMEFPFTYYYEYLALLAEGRHAITLVTLRDQARQIGTPHDTFDRINIDNLTIATRITSAVTTRTAAGQLPLNPGEHIARTKQANGQVLQAADASSAIPTRGAPGVLVVARQHHRQFVGGVRVEDVAMTDDHGRFLFPPCDSIKPPHEFQAFRIAPESGDIIGVKDMGEKGDGSSPTLRQWNNFDNPLRMMLFRCAQTDIYYPLHPLRGTELGEAFAVDRSTMTVPLSHAVIRGNQLAEHWGTVRVYGQGYSLFNPPAAHLYFGIRSPSALEVSIQPVGTFLLGDGNLSDTPQDGRNIWGPGYLAADTGSIRMWPQQAANAMATINGHRLARQKHHRVADPVVVAQHETAATSNRQALAQMDAGNYGAALGAALDSLAISMQVYPKIGKTQRDAVIAVVMYLFLLIPFSIFLERLVFGFSDIRTQMIAVLVIFAMVFGLLRLIHPAFELVSSGLMVLVGFLTLALSLFVTVFLFVRFQKNITQLRLHLQRTAEAADVSRLAAAGTAFVLGINNMRKRKVRTAFTCITLVLLTFALLSLTAVGRESQFRKIAVGKSSYTGLQIRGRNNSPVPGTASLLERFGQSFPTSRVVWDEYYHQAPPGSIRFSIVHPSLQTSGEFPVASVTKLVGLDPQEPQVTPVLDALLYGRWFKTDSERACILPLHAVQRLGITRDQVESEQAKAWCSQGQIQLNVIGVFDPAALDTVRDLDGDGFLPFDATVARKPEDTDALLNPVRLPRLTARDVALVTPRVILTPDVYRVAVNMNAIPPQQAMRQIRDYVQRSTDYVYYGIGGVAYMGRLVHGTQIHGLGEILVPLLIAAAIVLNTMLGSVYERASEIGVYSAVGLSPTHVHYLFLAESCVYATIGAVGGYLFAHGLGAVLGTLGLAGDLAFNYSTISTVYTTVALFAAVFLSTLYPARKAARMAMPSESTTIQVPEPVGDVMEFELPFTYVELDAISVIPYLHDVFEDHGEGSSADFFCQPPSLAGSVDTGENDSSANSYGLETRCWLKPYDLGVSQLMTLTIQPSSAPGMWNGHLRLTRLSGDINSWRRGNRVFLAVLRRHLLAWRGLEDEQRDEYLVRGLAALDISVERFV
jgi:hypothetical protein